MVVGLERLVDDARRRAAALHARRAGLERALATAPRAPAWSEAFDGEHLAVIAEVKRRSPSAGPIAPDLDAVQHAAAYVRGGASAISVLTDPVNFGGSMADLRTVASAVSVPVLCKDFVVDPLQLVEARCAGAAAVLLIVRVLPVADLGRLMREATQIGLGTLVEVHTAQEADVALDAGARLIGVNARDLDTFTIDPAGVEPILARLPAGVTGIAESGVVHVADVERVAAWGADGILVGTSVARSSSPEAAVRALAAVPRRGRPKGVL